MPAKKELSDYIQREIPYKILMKLYEDSRAPLKKMAREFGVSHNIVGKVLRELEQKYGLIYTLRLNEQALGFTEGRVITIKFTNMPDVGLLKERFKKDIFVQDAYLATGDFDLVLYVVGLSSKDYNNWQYKFRTDFGGYRPHLRTSTMNEYRTGFFPLRSELLSETTLLNSNEKKVLVLLNENSRIKLNELIGKSKLTQMRVIYILKKLSEKGIVEKYATLVQNPNKHLFIAYTSSHSFIESHQKLVLKFLEVMLKEDFHETVSDYAIMCNTHGFYDLFFLCAFDNGEVAAKRGPDILRDLWKEEETKVEKAIITSILIGKWPFRLENYRKIAEDISTIRKRL